MSGSEEKKLNSLHEEENRKTKRREAVITTDMGQILCTR